MLGIIFKSYISTMFWHKFHENIMMQIRKILLLINALYIYTGRRKISEENIKLYLLKSVENINNNSLN